MSYELMHFNIDQFRCFCCGENHMNDRFLQKLDKARHLADYPFKILSGYRCKHHNKKVGGVETSAHLSGQAADIQAKDNYARFKIIHALLAAGFNRLIVHKTFIHVDCDDEKPQEIFVIKC